MYANDTAYTEGSITNVESYINDILIGVGGSGGGNPPSGNIDPGTGWDLDKVTKVVSDDDVTVPVPIGYTASKATREKV